MAVLATYTQQPADRLDYDIPCDLVSGDAIQTVTVPSIEPVGLTINSLFTGPTVKLWVEGGTSGTTYKVEVLVETVLGRKKEFELKFKIKDV
jgi:hypothetical protein